MLYYLIFGLGFYISASLCRKDTFKNATKKQIIIGFLFGVVGWPLAAYYLIKDSEKWQ